MGDYNHWLFLYATKINGVWMKVYVDLYGSYNDVIPKFKELCPDVKSFDIVPYPEDWSLGRYHFCNY